MIAQRMAGALVSSPRIRQLEFSGNRFWRGNLCHECAYLPAWEGR